MLYFRSCPRCRGDMQLVEDHRDRSLSCLQCGFERDVPGQRAFALTYAAVNADRLHSQQQDGFPAQGALLQRQSPSQDCLSSFGRLSANGLGPSSALGTTGGR